MFDDELAPLDKLKVYVDSLTINMRLRQARLLLHQPISTAYPESYAGELPSRLQIMRAAGAANNIEGALVAAFILAELRDQSRAEDARDFIGAMVFGKETSTGLGQALPSTARKHDLFADALTNHATTFSATTARGNLNHSQLTWLLTSNETNIFAVARYIRILANTDATLSISALHGTRAVFPRVDHAAYADRSSKRPADNIKALGMYYTSLPWTDNAVTALGRMLATKEPLWASRLFYWWHVGRHTDPPFIEWHYDPVPTMAALTIPSLWILGAEDSSMPTQLTLEAIRKLQADGKPVESKVYPRAEHGMLRFEGTDGQRRAIGYEPDYFPFQIAWLKNHNMGRGDASLGSKADPQALTQQRAQRHPVRISHLGRDRLDVDRAAGTCMIPTCMANPGSRRK